MDKDTRNRIQRATQAARALLEHEYAEQLEGLFDIRLDGTIAAEPGEHLDAAQRVLRTKLIAAVDHQRAGGMKSVKAVTSYLREAAFTTLNRFVALKMLEARGLVLECISRGDQSAGFREFGGLAPGLVQLPDHGYRTYLESVFDQIGREVRVLFDRRDPAGLLWPRRQPLLDLFAILNASDLAEVWREDETIGWVYQYFNGDDERAAMRDVKRGGSQAPRNSYELAVRNQFFTPRYVVEFLVDNTLGWTWLEMHASSALAERCRYFVRTEEDATRARPRKDPRDLRIVDPACGSGHFLLYCFDLLLSVYEEGWAAETAGLCSEATGRPLRGDYPDLAELRRAAPALILEHNLHGVDIDARAAQIAALALWLRAQRAWQDADIPPADRPPVRRTNVVLAEPMPGDEALVQEFAARLDPPLLRGLFRKMVSEMRLAGELGALIPVEAGLSEELGRAREQFAKQRQTTGYLPGLEPVPRQGDLDLSGIDDDSFFHEAEARIVEALRQFAEAASGSAGVRRRLFAGDAAQGIALIDLLRTRFDVVLMNPPFGTASLAAKKEFEKAYPRTKSDLYAAFVERGIRLLHPYGLLGAITSRTGFFLSRFQRWREEVLLKEAPPVVFADLGYGVMDAAMVEAAAYCLEKARGNGMKTVFLRVIDADNKAMALLKTIREPMWVNDRERFEVNPASFASVPRSPFAYWVSTEILRLFETLPPFQDGRRIAASTNPLTEDFRYVRAWWEVPAEQLGATRRPWAKGGPFSPFYCDIPTVIGWDTDRSTYTGFLGGTSAWRRTRRHDEPGTIDMRPMEPPANFSHFLRPGLTWPRRTSGLSFRVLPRGSIFADKGPATFVEGDDPSELLALCAVANSRVFAYLMRVQLARTELAQSYEVGLVQQTPIPSFDTKHQAALSGAARRAWSSRRALDTYTETSHAFMFPALLQVPGANLTASAVGVSAHLRSVEARLARIEAEIDERCLGLYGIDEADRRAITETFGTKFQRASGGGGSDAAEEQSDEKDGGADATGLAADLVAWTVGVAFGRFDVRLATGACPLPAELEPFDPLPISSPGMLAGEDGLALATPPIGYPLALPEVGVLVDDPGNPQDIRTAVRAVFDAVFGSKADRWWHDAGTLLSPKGHRLHDWLAGSFFEHHIKRYSKSRRRAPILWQLGTPSGRYSVWLYVHRLTRDSFFQLQNDVVGQKLAHEERQLARLLQDVGGSPSASERKEIDAQKTFVEELRAMQGEVKRVAPLWNPNLDDGVIVNFAPLWRLVPQHRAWQKECKACWDKLCAGDYDWTHLAMHLWPERIVPKCATDRSLAIAHELEDIFWLEGSDGKWQPRKVDQADVDKLVEDRISPAVKDAIKSLLEAPAPASGRAVKKRRARAKTVARRNPSPRTTSEAKDASERRRAGSAPEPDLLSRVKHAIATSGEGASKSDVIETTGITSSQWNAAIKALLANGSVARAGKGRGTRYHPAGGEA